MLCFVEIKKSELFFFELQCLEEALALCFVGNKKSEVFFCFSFEKLQCLEEVLELDFACTQCVGHESRCRIIVRSPVR